MTDEATLLAAIIARPLDDLPRLCYADEMEKTAATEKCQACRGIGFRDTTTGAGKEFYACQPCHGTGEVSNGHAERSEFIRCQVELARTSCDLGWQNGYCCDRPECRPCALRRRERDILKVHGQRWTEEVMPASCRYLAPYDCDPNDGAVDNPDHGWIEHADGRQGHATVRFTRGFVSELECWWRHFRTHADAIRRATPLRDVTFTSPPPDYRACGACKDCCDRSPKFCERERERLGLPADITFHLPNVESVVSGFPSWGHEPGGWTAAQPLRSGEARR